MLSEHSCVVMRGVLAFTPVPFFSFCPSPWSVFGCPSHPPTAPLPRSWGTLSFVVLLSLSSCLSPSASRWAHGFSISILVQATRIFGHCPCNNLCPIFYFLLSMTVLWKQIPFLKLLFILSAFMTSAFMFKKVSGTACVSMKSSSRSSDP